MGTGWIAARNDLVRIALFSADLVLKMYPYLLGGIVLAAAVSTFLPRKRIALLFRPGSIPLAALLGAVSPICTHGTVPVFVQLLAAGHPVAPMLAFLSASSLISPQIFLFVLGALGGRIAAAYAVGSVVIPVVLAFLVRLFPSVVAVRIPEFARAPDGGYDRPSWTVFGKKTLDYAGFIAPNFVVGLLLAGAVTVLVPRAWVAPLVGQGILAVAAMAVLGIPLYACGGAAVILAVSFVELGLSGGAILAFLLAGPATRMNALAALSNVFRKRTVALYVFLVVALSCGTGYLFDLLFPMQL